MTEAFASLDVAMATYHREDRLPELLPLLVAQGDAAMAAIGSTFRFRVIVVDNDPQGSAREVVTGMGDPRIHYVVETNPGVTNARNRALTEAHETDLLAFIDDDELPHEDWLAQLLLARERYGVDAVAGPVYPILESDPEPWVTASRCYAEPQRARLRTGEPIRRAGTGNMLLDLRTVRRLGVRFDQRFGMTGGEDSVFTQQLSDGGARMVWCAEAVADHRVPEERATRRYLLDRNYSLGNSGVRAEVFFAGSGKSRVLTQLKWGVTCLGSVVKGTLQTLWGRLRGSLATRAAGELRVAGGLGGLAGLVGAIVTPYGDAAAPEETTS
ncbi:MAG: glycosyltransferase [Arachnia sp.]